MIPTKDNCKELYRIIRKDGGTTITPNKPSEDAIPCGVRIIAGEDKALTMDGEKLYSCKDISIENGIEKALEPWYEVDAPAEWRVRNDEDNPV